MKLGREAAIAAHRRELARLPARYRGCPLCGLVDGFPRDVCVLAETPHALALLSRYQLRRGHVLVLPKRHVETWTEIDWDEWRDVQRLSWEAGRTLERALAPERVYVATLGARSNVPTTFPHLHVHVVPVYESDARSKPSNVFTWKNGLDLPSQDEAAAMRSALTAAWTRAPRDETAARRAPTRARRRSVRGRGSARAGTEG